MERKRILKLWADEPLCKYVRDVAVDYFPNSQEDQEDACSEAWEKVAFADTRISIPELRKLIRNAIRNLWVREKYRSDPDFRDKVIKRIRRYQAARKTALRSKPA